MKQTFPFFSGKALLQGAAPTPARFTVKAAIAGLLLSITGANAWAQVPLVYGAENTGASCAAPALPTLSQLPTIVPLPDPFMWANGQGRSTSFGDWECRRNEIKAQIENYEIGRKPGRPQNMTASFNSTTSVLTVNVTENGRTLTLTSQVALPSGSGPFPAVIGMNSPSGGVPASVFTGRNIARITFNHNQVTTYYNPQLTDPFYRLYPDQNLSNAGQYAAWSWGVSRIIDGLELVQGSLPIDLQHLGVTGCSYAGKMALFASAFDERIALTIAQESGGGGAPAWRVSETLGTVEKLGATDYNWFKDDMRQFAGANVSKLPEDHHELMAMIAPRALLVTGNTDFEWLANPAAYVSARAAHEVWKQFGIGDRFGFYIDGRHGHCAVPATQLPAMQAFVDKFLAGNANVNTNIMVHPYPQIDYQRWYQWWGTNNPVLPAAQCLATATVPVATPDVLQTTPGTPITFTAAQLLGNDTDPQGRALAVGSISKPAVGTLTTNANGSYTYTPPAYFSGPVSLGYVLQGSGAVVPSPATGHYYEFVSAANISWTAARTAAAARTYQDMRGYLATVSSQDEQSFLNGRMAGQYWLGASDADVEGEWRWQTGPEAGTLMWQGDALMGTAVGFSNWSPGEPNDYSNQWRPQGEDYAMMYGQSGQWNDIDATGTSSSIAGYVVEYGGLESCQYVNYAAGSLTINVGAANPAARGTARPSASALAVGNALAAYPNPSNGDFQVRLSAPATGPVQLDLFDLQGRHVQSLLKENLAADDVREVAVHGRDLASGLYQVRLLSAKGTQYLRVSIQK